MICPYCDHTNIEGVDTCENCTQDLTGLDQPTGRTPVESSLMEAPLAKLQPKDPVIVSPEATVAETVAELCRKHVGCALVGSQDLVEGIFSERDVLMRIADKYDQVANLPVSEFMTRDPEMLEITTPIAFALNRMSVGDFRHIPVTEEGKLVGVVSLRDVVAFLGTWYPDLIPAKEPV